jgi:hypothetical protein
VTHTLKGFGSSGIAFGMGDVMFQGRVPVVSGCFGAGGLGEGTAFLVSVEWVGRPGRPQGDSHVGHGVCL